jgi:hypothetical protein
VRSEVTKQDESRVGLTTLARRRESVLRRARAQESGEPREGSADEAALVFGLRTPGGIGHLIGLLDQPLHAMEISAFDKHQDAPRVRRVINDDASTALTKCSETMRDRVRGPRDARQVCVRSDVFGGSALR